MILSTIKKVTAIYKVNSLFVFLLFLSTALGQSPSDLNSYCFKNNVNLYDVHQSLKILLLPKDIVEYRKEDGCLDIITSSNRGNLFEKFLSKRYDLRQVSLADEGEECRLDLKTTKKTKIDTSLFKIGEKNSIKNSEENNQSVSTMEILLGPGKPAEIKIGNEELKVACYVSAGTNAHLIFSLMEKNYAHLNSEIDIKKGEWINIGSVLNDLNNKIKTLGLPQTEKSETIEKNETIYEIQFK